MAEVVGSEIGLAEADWPLERQEVLGDRDGFMAKLEYGAMRAVVDGLGRLPIALQNALAGGLARTAMLVARRRNQAARTFVRQALGPDAPDARVDQLVHAAWRHLFTLSVRNTGYPRTIGRGSPLSRHSVTMSDDVRAVLAEGKGSILVTGHIGDWEAGGAVLPWVGFKPLYVISRPPRNRPLSKHFQRLREMHHVRLVHRHGAANAIPTILGGRGHVMMMLDQRAQRKFVVAPFFGKLTSCERGAAVMMRRLRVPVVFYATWLTDRPFHWETRFTRVLRPEDLAGKDPAEIMTTINRELEALILAKPEQYFWLHDRFRKKKPVADVGADATSGAEGASGAEGSTDP